jgi:hypothetical protein
MRHKRKVAAAMATLQQLMADPPPALDRFERRLWYLLMVEAAVLTVCLPRKSCNLIAAVQAGVLAGVERALSEQVERKRPRSESRAGPRSGSRAGKGNVVPFRRGT